MCIGCEGVQRGLEIHLEYFPVNKQIAEYIAQTVEKIDPEISIVVARLYAIEAPVPISKNIRRSWIEENGGWFKMERISLEHKIPGALLGFGEQSRILAIKWDDD